MNLDASGFSLFFFCFFVGDIETNSKLTELHSRRKLAGPGVSFCHGEMNAVDTITQGRGCARPELGARNGNQRP